MTTLEDYEIESERPAVHHFVSRVLALLDNEIELMTARGAAVRMYSVDES